MAEATPIRDLDDSPPAPAEAEVIYTQPSVRVMLTWTPAQIRAAESSADSGYISRAAELVDNVMADEKVSGALETRTGGLQGLPLSFENGRGGEAGESPQADELDEDWHKSYPEAELKVLQSWGIMLGVGFAQQVWKINSDGRFAPHLDVWHAKHFTWDENIQRWQFRDAATNELVSIEPDDPKWIVYTPYGRNRPWSRGLWRGLARWWMLKSYAVNDWGLHSEQASKLVVSDEAKDPRERSGSKDQRSRMANELSEMGKDGVIVLPKGYSLDLLEASADTTKLYGAQIDACNEGFVIAINGQNLTTSVKGGSLAAANVHERVEARRLRSDAETLSTALRGQSLVFWSLWNFGNAAVAPWPKWETDPPEDLANKAEVLDKSAAALVKLKAAGLEVADLEQFSQDYGLPELQVRETADDETDPGSGDGGGDDPSDGDDGGGDSGNEGDEGGGAGGDSQAGPSAKSSASPKALASGLLVAQAQGFADGQAWANSAADHGARLQAKDNRDSGFIDRLIESFEAEDYAAIEVAVLELFEDEDAPVDMADMITNLFVMSQRAGAVAVDQDA